MKNVGGAGEKGWSTNMDLNYFVLLDDGGSKQAMEAKMWLKKKQQHHTCDALHMVGRQLLFTSQNFLPVPHISAAVVEV